jgi:hypothetical protein
MIYTTLETRQKIRNPLAAATKYAGSKKCFEKMSAANKKMFFTHCDGRKSFPNSTIFFTVLPP